MGASQILNVPVKWLPVDDGGDISNDEGDDSGSEHHDEA